MKSCSIQSKAFHIWKSTGQATRDSLDPTKIFSLVMKKIENVRFIVAWSFILKEPVDCCGPHHLGTFETNEPFAIGAV